ncbi:MAG: ribbon-helix-helix domain-containing protein [Ginsengibacter sp.]
MQYKVCINMTSRLTISIDSEAKKKLHLLAKNRQRSVSRFIKELIMEESKKAKIKTSDKSLGTYLSNLPLTEIPNYKNDKEIFGKLKEDKHLGKR